MKSGPLLPFGKEIEKSKYRVLHLRVRDNLNLLEESARGEQNDQSDSIFCRKISFYSAEATQKHPWRNFVGKRIQKNSSLEM